MDKTNGSRTHNHHTYTYTLPVILEPHTCYKHRNYYKHSTTLFPVLLQAILFSGVAWSLLCLLSSTTAGLQDGRGKLKPRVAILTGWLWNRVLRRRNCQCSFLQQCSWLTLQPCSSSAQLLMLYHRSENSFIPHRESKKFEICSFGSGTTELFLAVFFDFQQRKVLGWASFSYVPGSEIDEKRAGRSGRRRDLRRRWGGAQWRKGDMCL